MGQIHSLAVFVEVLQEIELLLCLFCGVCSSISELRVWFFCFVELCICWWNHQLLDVE